LNIFVLDENPRTSAEMMCNKHVVKMIVESAQMLSTVHRYLDGHEYISISKNKRRIKRWSHDTDTNNSETRLFKSVMLNHPCTIWARESTGNYAWLASHAISLCYEYTHRYDKIHKTEDLCRWFLSNYPSTLRGFHLTPFAQAMPDEYKNADPVEAYRAYYRGEKASFAKWTSRNVPEWFLTNEVIKV
tara:strand:- start:1570 stop:2133 length:564 start_codon:yes stop_codon:yes gene_type:complete